MINLVDCAKIRSEILETVKEGVVNLGYTPSLAIVTCSDDEASKIYVRNKIKTCNELGINVYHYDLDYNEYSQRDLEEFVEGLNREYNGILVQLPLHPKFNADKIINCIHWEKDVDGLTTYQKGLLADGKTKAIIPCTALGCKIIMDKVLGPVEGKNATIINRSDLIGKPLSTLLRNEGATVTVCHSKTNKKTIDNLLKTSDIIVTGTGNKHLYSGAMFKGYNQLVIDCSIVRDENGKICGDVYTDSLKVVDNSFVLSPSPKGVGSLVTALVCFNLLKCCLLQDN